MAFSKYLFRAFRRWVIVNDKEARPICNLKTDRLARFGPLGQDEQSDAQYIPVEYWVSFLKPAYVAIAPPHERSAPCGGGLELDTHRRTEPLARDRSLSRTRTRGVLIAIESQGSDVVPEEHRIQER